MKIQRLDLLAFGAFTGQSLDLSEGDHGLHIIYGPNESGKSTSLRAVEQLLYGIPVNSTDHFVHPNKQLRIGGRLAHSDGRRLNIIRRKAKAADLRDENDVDVIDESQLLALLDGCNRTYFRKMFGLSHTTLVEGGEALFKGTGELGQVLFSAGSGVADVNHIAEKLNDGAQSLFLPMGTKPLINAALSQLKDAQREIKTSEISAADWEQLDGELKSASLKKNEIELAMRSREHSLQKMQRIQAALPFVGQRSELAKTLEQLKDAILLPPDFADESRRLQSELKKSTAETESTKNDIEEIEYQLASIEIPEGLIERTSVIEDLQRKLGSHQKAISDRSGLLVRVNQHRDAIKMELQNLGHPPDLTLCEKLKITVQQRTLIRDLASAKNAIKNNCDVTAARAKQISEHLEDLQSQLATIEEMPDPEALSKAVRGVEQMGALEDQLQLATKQVENLSQQLAVGLKRLAILPSGVSDELIQNPTWDKLESIALPSNETIDRFYSEMETQAQSFNALRKNLEQVEQDVRSNKKNLAQLELEMNTPSEADLQEARDKRDGGWQLIHRAWSQGDENKEAIQTFTANYPEAKDLAAAYEESVDIADTLADRLRRESAQVAKKAALMAEDNKLAQRREALEAHLEHSRIATLQLQESWIAAWDAAKITPLPPKEMRSWCQKFSESVALARSLRDATQNVESLQSKIDQCRDNLVGHLQSLTQSPLTIGSSLTKLLSHCHDVVDNAVNARNKRANLIRDLEKSQSDLRKSQKEAETAQGTLDKWMVDWTKALAPISLDATTTPSQANDVIDALDRLLKHLAEAQDLNNRIKGIDRDANDFASAVQNVVALVANDLADFPAEQGASELNARLVKARASKERFDVLSKEMKKKQEILRISKSKIRECMDGLDLMCKESKSQNYESLLVAAEDSSRLRRAKEDLAQVDKALLNLSGGVGISKFLEDVSTVDPDLIKSSREELSAEIAKLTEEKTQYDQAIGRAQAELARIDGSGLAAEAAEKTQELLAKIAGASGQYARLHIANFILRRAIERYREKNQSPVLRRASEIFAVLTLGAFIGLREDFNDRGEPILVGMRSNGTLVNLYGMSEGTCDQAYLALRIASIEIYLDNHESMPFVVDDILVNFDDERSRAALEVLEELSRRTQIIFFSHHAHLVELAKKAVSADALFVHELGRLAAGVA